MITFLKVLLPQNETLATSLANAQLIYMNKFLCILTIWLKWKLQTLINVQVVKPQSNPLSIFSWVVHIVSYAKRFCWHVTSKKYRPL